MYSHVDPKYALLLANRFYDGGNQTLRYPDDAYDRIWVPQTGFGSITVSVKGNGGSRLPDDKNVPIYITTYFSEVDKTIKRSLQFSIDSKPYDRPVVPPFGSVAVAYITNMTASSNTSFSIQAAADSSIPPLINAYEVYTITGPLAQATNSKDGTSLIRFNCGICNCIMVYGMV
ncbi:putative malectin-like carbohydrate-binding domain-containing protein [Rosa chinensis]|uniref:Putative malectin-like carbohydrate-binding domain-containing protein n=2 Tax=Rosa chinensis TaxID=74649 RepID=A0A2P6P1N0_ROSCH|nr:putative malectin-like carbohydrate-binding domain-containing protein [Rosa chinensis]